MFRIGKYTDTESIGHCSELGGWGLWAIAKEYRVSF